MEKHEEDDTSRDQIIDSYIKTLVMVVGRVSAPQYRMLPTQTNLKMPPLPSNMTEKVLPAAATQSKTSGGVNTQNGEEVAIKLV
ncbi:uncharacterized protein LOC132311161 isoform X2 [Cornus florida]|uniref:uncharacterized protein LOC132311161 isoform X2 n=1 Tax=Cornus florida TaxID=4283 RepID=UPI0028A1547F|nr:uncharacterized protein LOC132311161 isoform X2 [Cornus florida]